MLEDIDFLFDVELEHITIGTIASHSALDIFDGAKEEGFHTVAICESGREKTYVRHGRIIDNYLFLEKFEHVLTDESQKNLKEMSTIFVPNRSLTAYVPTEKIEKDFRVPIFGNRYMLKTDERKYQYEIFKDAGIPHPVRFESYNDIDRLCIIKAKEPKKKIEREFFTASSATEAINEWKKRFGEDSQSLFDKQLQTDEAWIEEYITGAYFNFNYFYSPIKGEVEFLGVDRRIQTNLDGLLRMPARDQLAAGVRPEYIEVGHENATVRESLMEKVYDIGEKFVASSKKLYSPGVIGPFALQSSVTPNLDIIVYDLSPRIPGSPVLYNSPYSKYFFGQNVTSGRRIAMEIKEAVKTNQLGKILT